MVEHNLIIETANKIINKQGKSVALAFLQIVVVYASELWRQEGTPCIFHSRKQVNFAGL